MRSSPTLAAVISFWPDHLELHGTLDRYRAAKEQIVRQQRPGDSVVVNADDAAAGFADATPANVWELSLANRVERGAFLDEERGLVVTDGTTETALGHIERARGPSGQHRRGGGDRHRSRSGPPRSRPGAMQSHRPGARNHPARSAAFPSSTTAWPRRRRRPRRRSPRTRRAASCSSPAASNDAGGGSVHATPAEIALLEQACDVIARVARVVVLFGEAGPRLAPLLARRQVELVMRATSRQRSRRRGGEAAGATAVVFAPLFPVALGDRERFGALVRRAG